MTTEKYLSVKTVSKEEVLIQHKLGKKLNIFTTMSGKKDYNFLPEPVLKPTFLIIEKYRLSSFLGQYGAGRTIKTFSLLPGEKTTISITSYKRSETTSASSSSILDSYTEEKADEFESTVAAENSTQESESKNFEYHAEAEAEASWGWGKAKVSGGVSGSTDSAREEFAKNTSAATSKHAASASAKRDVEINTNFQSKVEEGLETATTREISNINVGRTLNFTFRQMNQEFITLLHLVDIRVAFFNGYAESKDEVSISAIDDLMEKYVVSGQRKAVKETILKQIKSVRDHLDQTHEVIEEVVFQDSPTSNYWRFKKGLVYKYTDPTTGVDIDVPGIVLSADKNVMRTEGVIVEALLGQANALDDYSLGLQNEKVRAQTIENEMREVALQLEKQKLEILKSKDLDASEVYKRLFPAAPIEPSTGEK